MGTARSKKSHGGSQQGRSATVTVRLEPELRYLASLAARRQRRTLSSFLEWAVAEALKNVPLDPSESDLAIGSIHAAASRLWDVDEADRFAKLAFRCPDLLTHDEQVLWKLVRECGFFWKCERRLPGAEHPWAWHVLEENLVFSRLRQWWPVLAEKAVTGADVDGLPSLDEENAILEDRATTPGSGASGGGAPSTPRR